MEDLNTFKKTRPELNEIIAILEHESKIQFCLIYKLLF